MVKISEQEVKMLQRYHIYDVTFDVSGNHAEIEGVVSANYTEKAIGRNEAAAIQSVRSLYPSITVNDIRAKYVSNLAEYVERLNQKKQDGKA